MSEQFLETKDLFPELIGPPDIPGHRYTYAIKDWMPGFNEAITNLYRQADECEMFQPGLSHQLTALAEKYEAQGFIPYQPKPRALGSAAFGILKTIQAQHQKFKRIGPDGKPRAAA